VETRRQVENGWRFVADLLSKDGHHDLANDVRRFVERMPPAKTEREQIAHELRQRVRDLQPTRWVLASLACGNWGPIGWKVEVTFRELSVAANRQIRSVENR
jgi:hypothetical protein